MFTSGGLTSQSGYKPTKTRAPLDLFTISGHDLTTSDYEDRDLDWNWAIAVGPQRDFNRGNRWSRVSR